MSLYKISLHKNSSNGKISVKGLLARSRYKLPKRGLFARCLYEIFSFCASLPGRNARGRFAAAVLSGSWGVGRARRQTPQCLIVGFIHFSPIDLGQTPPFWFVESAFCLVQSLIVHLSSLQNPPKNVPYKAAGLRVHDSLRMDSDLPLSRGYPPVN